MEHIKVLIAEQSREKRALIVDAISDIDYIKIIGEVTSQVEALDKLNINSPDVILLGSFEASDIYKTAEVISEAQPDISIIIMEDKLKEDIIHKALFAGARDVLVYPFQASKLIDTIYRANELSKKRRLHNRPAKNHREAKQSSKVITVFSTKGGVGKTFIAVNLAVAIQKASGKKVALVDLDLDFGNIALALNITPRFTLTDVIDDIRNIHKDIIESYMTPFSENIMILPTNSRMQATEFIKAEHVETILRVLQSSFDYIIADMPARFYEPVNPAFVVADDLFMITTPELSTIRNIKSALLTLDELNYPKSKLKIILNRADVKGIIKAKDVETTLNHKLYSIITADYKTAISSLNQGNPAILQYNRSNLAKEFTVLANKVVQDSVFVSKHSEEVI